MASIRADMGDLSPLLVVDDGETAVPQRLVTPGRYFIFYYQITVISANVRLSLMNTILRIVLDNYCDCCYHHYQ